MTRSLNKMLVRLFCVLLTILVCATFIVQYSANNVSAEGDTPTASVDTPADDSPTFEITEGKKDGSGNASYMNLLDGSTDSKYCIDINLEPYIIFRSSDIYTLVSGYTLYTGNDTSTHTGRNPKSWTLYGSYDGTKWYSIHAVTNDTTMGTEDKTGYSFTFDNTVPFWYYKLEITGRQGGTAETGSAENDWNMMQISEIEFNATVASDAVDVSTAEAFATNFAQGNKIRLVNDITLASDADISMDGKVNDIDLNGHVISGGKITIYAENGISTSLILHDSDPTATHADSSLPAGGVINSQIVFNRNPEASEPPKACLYANGGTITQKVQVTTGYAKIENFGESMTTFMDGISGCGIVINGGLFYGDITSTNTTAFSTSCKKVTFKNGDNTYATQYVKSGSKAASPINPAPEGYNLLAWRNVANNANYDFSNEVTADLTLSAILSKDVSTAEEFKTALESGNSVKLTADIQLTEVVDIKDGKYVIIDLNGHVVSEHKVTLWASTAGATSVVLCDSDPTATHADSSLPAGGVIASQIFFNREAEVTSPQRPCLYANGGTATKDVYCNTGYGNIDYFGDTMTTFMGVCGMGAKINGGFYYGALTPTYEGQAYTTDNKKVVFKIGDNVYATQYLRSGDKAICPATPTVEGYTFLKWYNSANNEEYNFSSTVTDNLTINAMLSKEVSTFEAFKTEIENGNSVKLIADIELTDLVYIHSSKNIIMDLNGHVISTKNSKEIKGTGCGGTENPGPSTRLTVIDSNPTAAHADASLPTGGYIGVQFNITASSNWSGSIGEFHIYANGGTIYKVHANSFACMILWSGNTPPSVILNVSGGTSAKGGLYYKDQGLNTSGDASVKKVTYKDGDTVYATLGMNSVTQVKKAVVPKEPAQKAGYSFDGWYLGENKYDFSADVTKDITLTAKWVEDNTAPVISGVDEDDVYCLETEVTITEDYLDNVTVDGVEVEVVNGKFMLDMSAGADVVIVATDKAFNSTEITVKFGHNTDGNVAHVDPNCTTDGRCWRSILHTL